MDNDGVVHIHCGKLLRCKEKNKIMNFAGKWMGLEQITLSG